METNELDRSSSLHKVWRIRRTLHIHGELTADRNVSIEGEFDGTISLAGHELSTGASSRVRADIRADRVLVRGEVHGNIIASDRVTITRTGKVYGEIRAPRLKLEPTSTVRGRVVCGEEFRSARGLEEDLDRALAALWATEPGDLELAS